MQNHYSLLYREEEREMNAYCDFAGIGLIPWGPLNAGRLARPLAENTTTRGEGRKNQPAVSTVHTYGRTFVLTRAVLAAGVGRGNCAPCRDAREGEGLDDESGRARVDRAEGDEPDRRHQLGERFAS